LLSMAIAFAPVGHPQGYRLLCWEGSSDWEQIRIESGSHCHLRSAPQGRADAIERNVVQSQWSDKKQTNEEHVTMDGEEWELLERYEAHFGETPPVAFLDPNTSKRMIKAALRKKRPFNEKDLESRLDAPP